MTRTQFPFPRFADRLGPNRGVISSQELRAVPRFDRYLLSQLMVLFGFFALILVSVYWVNRAVALFDQLIANGQSAVVFLEFTILTLPNVIRLVLPLAAFGAAVYATNRLSSDSELTVMQATGFGPFRLARPVFFFGLIVALLMSALTHYLVPRSIEQLTLRQAEIAENVTAGLLTEGVFLHPADGVTFYIREISPQGEMKDIFLSDARSAAFRTTYTARRALLVRDETGPKLVMFDGMAQTLAKDSRRLDLTQFQDFAYDIGSLLQGREALVRNIKALPTWQLLNPSDELVASLGVPRADFLNQGHGRFSQAIFAIVGALVGFSTLLLGGFSRFGLWRQIMGAVGLMIVLKLFENTMVGMTERNTSLWPLVYLPSVAGLGVSALILWIAGRPARRPRPTVEAAA